MLKRILKAITSLFTFKKRNAAKVNDAKIWREIIKTVDRESFQDVDENGANIWHPPAKVIVSLSADNFVRFNVHSLEKINNAFSKRLNSHLRGKRGFSFKKYATDDVKVEIKEDNGLNAGELLVRPAYSYSNANSIFRQDKGFAPKNEKVDPSSMPQQVNATEPVKITEPFIEGSDASWLAIVLDGQFRGHRFILQNGREYVFGRQPNVEGKNVISLPDRYVSRQQFMLNLASTPPTLSNLSKTNQTMLNGKPVNGDVVITDGDTIRCANISVAIMGA